MFAPIARALSQFDDPIFRGVLWRSLVWAIGCFVALHVGAVWGIHRMFGSHGLFAWGAEVAGSIGASLLTLWLFLPVSAAIGTLYLDRIADAVERRFYPWLAPPKRASLASQAWDGSIVALKVLGLNIIALILVCLLPGVGLLTGWMIAAYAIGRGLFVAVAMRRMPRTRAESYYRARRGTILTQGAIVAAATYVPILNLFVPIVAVAAMVHVLDVALADRS